MKKLFQRLEVLLVAMVLVCTSVHGATQQIVLEAGWNLVSVQVGSNAWNVADFESGETFQQWLVIPGDKQ